MREQPSGQWLIMKLNRDRAVLLEDIEIEVEDAPHLQSNQRSA